MYDFTDLKLIRYIAEEQTLSAVATRAKISLPAVSQRLSKLESSLNSKLVHRTGGGLRLTKSGEIFLSSADAIHAEIEELESRLKAVKQAQSNLLRVGCSDGVLLSHLGPVIGQLAVDYPLIQLVLEELDSHTGHQRLTDGEVDIALLPHQSGRSNIHSTPYRKERLCIVAPLTNSISLQNRPLPISSLQEYGFVGLLTAPFRSHIEELCETNGIHLEWRFRVPSVEAQCALISQINDCLALTYESAARRYARTQPIAVIRLSDQWAFVDFVASRLKEASSAVADRLLEILVAAHPTA